MGRRWVALCSVLLFAAMLLPTAAYAHGADIEYTVSTEVEIVATYDTGGPMDGGQVTIYAPNDPANPWDDPGTGLCDAEGKYSFTPDPDIPAPNQPIIKSAIPAAIRVTTLIDSVLNKPDSPVPGLILSLPVELSSKE